MPFVNLERLAVQSQTDTPVSFSQAQPPHPFKVDATERQDVSGFFTYFSGDKLPPMLVTRPSPAFPKLPGSPPPRACSR